MDIDFKDSLCTNPSIVQVSVQETTAQSGDPGKNCPPLNVVSNSPGERGGKLIKSLHIISLHTIMYL